VWLPTASSTAARVEQLRRRLDTEQDPRRKAMLEAQLVVLDPRSRYRDGTVGIQPTQA
jgi:hypothetical protein